MTTAIDIGPVAVGGLGGSGTRVIAAALRHAGLRIGERLNRPLDNLWFTVLFKRLEWLERLPEKAELTQAADMFVRAMTRGLEGQVTQEEAKLIERLGNALPPHGTWRCGARLADAESLARSNAAPSGHWGWKEPNTHIFLPALNAAIPNLHYIHVVRDGLDMAYSSNTWQMKHWSHFYGLPLSPDTPQPVRQLQYWIRANNTALNFGRESMPGRFLVIPYEEFCAHTTQHLERLVEFLGLRGVHDWPEDMIQAKTIGRAQKFDLSALPEDTLDEARLLTRKVAELGGIQ